MPLPISDERWHEAIDMLCYVSARRILSGIPFAEFRTYMVGMVDYLLGEMGVPKEERHADMQQAMATLVALEIWNITPLPDKRFRPNKLPKPQRNDPCLCGSGRKFKQCCGAVEAPALGIGEEFMLAKVLQNLPRKTLKELPVLDLHPDALAAVAHEWMGERREKDAIALLERLFAHLPQLDARAEAAADVLLSAYLDTDAPRKKARFIEALQTTPDKTLRSAGWQRQATVLSDKGDYAAAWEAFREALRLTPNAPALSHLEVLILVSEGRRAEAKARAAFWSARLARDPAQGHRDLIALLRDLADDSDESALRTLQRSGSPLAPLAEIIAHWPPPACEYKLTHGEVLEAKPKLEDLENRWMDARDDIDGLEWLDLLAREPLASQSFYVIRDCVDLLHMLPEPMPGSNEALARRLLERGEALRRTVLEKLKALNRELPWGCMENRPLQTVVSYYINEFAASRPEETLNLLRWLVNVANPNDNLGLRETLIHRLVAAGLADEALAVAARYPDDFAAMEYGRVLALFAAGQTEVAESALRATHARYPKPWKMLHAANPRRPRSKNPGYITVGGDDEAYLYRENHLTLWRSTGALRWGAGVSLSQANMGKKTKPSAAEQSSLPGLE